MAHDKYIMAATTKGEYVYAGLKHLFDAHYDWAHHKRVPVHMLCYQIASGNQFPYVKIIAEHTLTEFAPPIVYMDIDDGRGFSEYIEKHVRQLLLKTDSENTGIVFRGTKILRSHPSSTLWAIVDVGGVCVSNFLNKYWSILPTEIMNSGSICGIPVSPMLISMFQTHSDLGVLEYPKTSVSYMLPDVTYTRGTEVQMKLQAEVGVFAAVGGYYCTHSRPFPQHGEKPEAICRHAVFYHGWLHHFEEGNKLQPILFPRKSQTIFIKYGVPSDEPDVMVTNRELIIPLGWYVVK